MDSLRWMPVLEGEWGQLLPGLMVATEGQKQWRRLLGEAVGGEFDVSYLCKREVRYERMRGEEVVAVKVETIPVYSIKGVGVCMRQLSSQRRGGIFLIR